MSLSTPVQIAVPFAVSGLKNTIPASSDNVTGHAGYDQGFPPINMVLKAAGGIPPFGRDFNGIFYDNSVAIQYLEAGNGFVYNSTFSTAIGGYKPGARVLRADGLGYWLNTVDGNTTDPAAAGAAAAGWVPDFANGITSVAMTNANVTLTPAQYGKPIIVITGLLTANLNLIFPAISAQWTVFNNTTGAFTITCKTAAGTGSVVTQGGGEFYSGNGTNLVPAVVSTQALGDNSQKPASTAYADRAGAGGASGNCYLSKSGANLLLLPKNGNRLTINGAPQTVPSGGVTLAPDGLIATTLYYIYAYMVGAVMTLEASTTGHSTDATTGVEIKTGDATRTLVGMARPIAGPAFTDTATQRFVRSWFNNPGVACLSFLTANATTTSASFVEINTSLRNEFLAWAAEIVATMVQGGGLNSALGEAATAIGFDGIAPEEGGTGYGGSAVYTPVSAFSLKALSEGYHYATMLGCVPSGGGTATWTGGASAGRRVSVQTSIKG